MLSRRSLFSLFAAIAAIIAGAKVEASPASEAMDRGGWSVITFTIPEGMKYEIMVCSGGGGGSEDAVREHSDCEHKPVNMRADGTIRHRQHHPVDFPTRR